MKKLIPPFFNMNEQAAQQQEQKQAAQQKAPARSESRSSWDSASRSSRDLEPNSTTCCLIS